MCPTMLLLTPASTIAPVSATQALPSICVHTSMDACNHMNLANMFCEMVGVPPQMQAELS